MSRWSDPGDRAEARLGRKVIPMPKETIGWHEERIGHHSAVMASFVCFFFSFGGGERAGLCWVC